MGEMKKEAVFDLLDYFHSQGGNFIDTANNYQSEQSEIWIGEWLAARPDVRDQMVIATKYTTNSNTHRGHDKIVQVNFGGNNAKSMRLSIDRSLKNLQTNYIDLFYVHWWDFTTGIPELMLSLNSLVEQGKVLYLGVSDTPAWVVSKANEYARCHGLRQFVTYQGRWSAADRDFEREIVGMCAAEGMSMAPWGALGGGNFKSEKQREASKNEGRQVGGPNETQIKVSKVLEEIAESKGTAITSVALAYVMHKAPYVFPVVGGRKIEHLKGNIEALGLELTPEDMDKIEGAAEFDVGFPLQFLSNRSGGPRDPSDLWLAAPSGKVDYVEKALVGFNLSPSIFIKFPSPSFPLFPPSFSTLFISLTFSLNAISHQS